MTDITDNGWIGVDLDGTLAEYHGWQGEEHIGRPLPMMVARVKLWLEAGEDVRIFTARVWEGQGNRSRARDAIRIWCLEHLGRTLPVTCVKDWYMRELWDDRCVQVKTNTGEPIYD
jgi:hypothetical protein